MGSARLIISHHGVSQLALVLDIEGSFGSNGQSAGKLDRDTLSLFVHILGRLGDCRFEGFRNQRDIVKLKVSGVEDDGRSLFLGLQPG